MCTTVEAINDALEEAARLKVSRLLSHPFPFQLWFSAFRCHLVRTLLMLILKGAPVPLSRRSFISGPTP